MTALYIAAGILLLLAALLLVRVQVGVSYIGDLPGWSCGSARCGWT